MTKAESEPLFLSLVVPAFNEEAMIYIFYERAIPILSALDGDFELIIVNDGSSDATGEKVRELHAKDPRVKLIDLSRNFGKEIAMTAGLDLSSGAVVIVMDADLQDPPELIPEMIRKWREGYDTVYATRTVREGETFLKKSTANIFYRLISRLTKIKIPANTGDFRLMSRRTVDALKLLREHHRFMKGVFAWVGFKQTQIYYQREPRAAGYTKWNYWKLWNFAIEGITSFSYGPLKLSSYLGFSAAFFAFCYALFLIIRTLIFGRDLPGYASIMVVVLFFSGVQLVFLGILGEYVGRMFNETKRRPLYLIQDLLGVDQVNENVFLEKAPVHEIHEKH